MHPKPFEATSSRSPLDELGTTAQLLGEQIHLETKIRGSSSRRSALSKAAKKLYNQLYRDNSIRRVAGQSIQIPNPDGSGLMPYGKLPSIQNSHQNLWLPALELLLHSLSNAVSASLEKAGCHLTFPVSVIVPYGLDALRSLNARSGVNGAVFKKAIACLVHIGWLELNPAKESRRPFVSAKQPLVGWLIEQDLVCPVSPKMTLHS